MRQCAIALSQIALRISSLRIRFSSCCCIRFCSFSARRRNTSTVLESSLLMFFRLPRFAPERPPGFFLPGLTWLICRFRRSLAHRDPGDALHLHSRQKCERRMVFSFLIECPCRRYVDTSEASGLTGIASLCTFLRVDRSSGPRQPTIKKADVVEHPKVFDHVGLLVNAPPGRARLLSI